ncbi:ABC transporter ATP-binding protein [Georgenia faecalis]|uniref:ABC transporter ATP-binding protein n=1 Tax=Georgenia faecalis TaxID=2483799 RepID=A0ABV9DBY1_9MICO|nr:ABC transporter ATP-binding protein [Georgenia faecalis]
MSALLEVTGLRISVGSKRSRTTVVQDVELALDAGETLGVVGESGSGKSMSGLAVLDLLPPVARVDEGTAIFEGRDLFAMTKGERRRLRATLMKMVFQDPMTSLNPVMRVGAQLRESVMAQGGVSRQDASRQAVELLDRVGIPDPAARARRYPHEFSGGMRQRVMIAMAVAARPKLLIADEPTTALDVTVQSQVVELVKDLQDQFGTAVIWITHDLALLAGVADRVAVMYAGRVVESATSESIYRAPRHPYTIGLLESIPAPHFPHQSALPAIPGAPPDPRDVKAGCPFADRCSFVIAHCRTEMPPLAVSQRGDRAACWVQPQVTMPSGKDL